MIENYTVSSPKGVNERTVMHPWKGYSGRYDNGEQLMVHQTYSIVIAFRSYIWGRITALPDQYGRHKYVCLSIDNNILCTKNAAQPLPPFDNKINIAQAIDLLESALSVLKGEKL